MECGFRNADFGVRILECGFSSADFGVRNGSAWLLFADDYCFSNEKLAWH